MSHIIPPIVGWIRSTLDLNITVFINIGLALIAVIASLRSAWAVLYGYAEKTCLTTVYIKEDDPLYHDILLWMDDHVFRRHHFRSVLAVTTNQSDIHHREATSSCTTTLDPSKGDVLHGQSTDRGPSIQLKPFQGSRIFSFRRKWIIFNHTASGTDTNRNYYQATDDKLRLKLQCLSFSLSPLHEFLTEATLYNRRISVSSITVYRAISNAREIVRWGRITSQPCRDMSTVILDERKKQKILHDITEYLDPQTRQWYANHGIPYRRGYLFSGPPGTGKTSLASAIAGAFSLDIYVLSLLDPNVTESQFIRLFSELPSQCVVLLEDIDVAGMEVGSKDALAPKNSDGHPAPYTSKRDLSNTVISLSGLLNAIDGVSSHEGRILIMTTNAPQTLDRALIRPGRVDMHLQFELPSRQELRALFLSMFSDVSRKGPDEEGEKSESIDLDALAMAFADKLPERKLTLAEVQGFLLQYKKRPVDACDHVSSWIMEMTEGDWDSQVFTT